MRRSPTPWIVGLAEFVELMNVVGGLFLIAFGLTFMTLEVAGVSYGRKIFD